MEFSRILHTDTAGRFSILFLHSLRATAENAAHIAKTLTQLLCENKPSLVVWNGDTVTDVETEAALRQILTVITAPMEAAGIPWVQLFGDEDRHGGLSNGEALSVYQSFPHCCTVAGPEAVPGVGNFILPVYSGAAPAFLLWCLDAHCGTAEYERDCGVNSPARLPSPMYTRYYTGGVRFAQSMWYWHTSRRLEQEYGRRIPGLMAFHIPTPEHTVVPMNASLLGMTGIQYDHIRCQTVCGGIFAAALECGNVRAILSGHGERNDFRGSYGGIILGQYPAFGDGCGLLVTWRDGEFTYESIKYQGEAT